MPGKWAPTHRIADNLAKIRGMLLVPSIEASNSDKVVEYNNNREEYVRVAREWTRMYAMGNE